MKCAVVIASVVTALVAGELPAYADPVADVFDQLTPEQTLDATNMGPEWCDYIEYSDTPAQGAMMAMDDAYLNFDVTPQISAAMVWVGVRLHCKEYIPDVASAAQTWQRRQRNSH